MQHPHPHSHHHQSKNKSIQDVMLTKRNVVTGKRILASMAQQKLMALTDAALFKEEADVSGTTHSHPLHYRFDIRYDDYYNDTEYYDYGDESNKEKLNVAYQPRRLISLDVADLLEQVQLPCIDNPMQTDEEEDAEMQAYSEQQAQQQGAQQDPVQQQEQNHQDPNRNQGGGGRPTVRHSFLDKADDVVVASLMIPSLSLHGGDENTVVKTMASRTSSSSSLSPFMAVESSLSQQQQHQQQQRRPMTTTVKRQTFSSYAA